MIRFVMRLFFALDIPYSTKIAIHNWREKAFANRTGIPVENFHITLSFMGQASNQQCESLIEQASQVNFSEFLLTTSHLGYFSKPKVSWLGIEPQPQLVKLQSSCKDIAQRYQLGHDKNPFTPHISLYRHEKEPPAPLIEEVFQFTVHSFGLFESQSTPSGVRYHCIESFSANRR